MLKLTSRRLPEMAALLGPLALVLVIRIGHPEARVAPPAVALASASLFAEVKNAPVLDAEQQGVVDWLAGERRTALASPMDHPTARPVTPVVRTEAEPTPPQRPVEPAVDPLAGFKLTAVVGASDGALASINGHVYRTGDELVAGWRIKTIDVQAQSVTVESDDGDVATIKQDRPQIGR